MSCLSCLTLQYILQGVVAKYFSSTFPLFKNTTNLSLLAIMHVAPPLAKSPLISSYSSKKCLTKIIVGYLSKLINDLLINDYNIFLLLMGGWCILNGWMMYPISPCQPLHAVGYPFDCPNNVCLITFPNINQTPKQNYPSQLEKTSGYRKENEPEIFQNTYPYTNLAYNVMSAYLIM